MALFDELKERATDVVQVAGKKVEEAYGATKIKLVIADKQSQLRTLYKELGEIVYENSKSDAADLEKVEDKISEIDIVLEAVEELKSQERSMKKMVACPSCGKDVAEDANFCSECGCEMK